MKLQNKFDGIMKSFISQRKKLQGLSKDVNTERKMKMVERDQAEVMIYALDGLDNRINKSVEELNAIIGDS